MFDCSGSGGGSGSAVGEELDDALIKQMIEVGNVNWGGGGSILGE